MLYPTNAEPIPLPDVGGIVGSLGKSIYGHSNARWLVRNFHATDYGFLVYKTFGHMYTPPEHWGLHRVPGYFMKYRYSHGDLPRVITSKQINKSRREDCGAGINFGTFGFMHGCNSIDTIYLCLLLWEDVRRLVVPGKVAIVPGKVAKKARTDRLVVLRSISDWDLRSLDDKHDGFEGGV